MGPQVCTDLFANPFFIGKTRYFCRVLRGDQDRVDGNGAVVFIHNTHLGFAIREEVVEGAVVAHFRQTARQTVRQADG